MTQPSGTRRRVGVALIVEDNPTLVVVLEQLLDDEGYTTSTAKSITAARERVAELKPDVVLLDLTLTDGFADTFLPELVAARIPTVIVSTFPLAQLLAEKYGVELVSKPFELTCLLEGIERARRTQPANTG
jgi:DNA-binding NtrC family response regulator